VRKVCNFLFVKGGANNSFGSKFKAYNTSDDEFAPSKEQGDINLHA